MKLDLFLLVGQSNMAGRGKLDGNAEAVDSRIVSLNKEGEWVPAADPLHFDKPEIIGVGPGLTFARTLAERGVSESIGLIPCAVGGTEIERWIRGGDLYAEAMRRAKLAMQSGELKGILWHQGEGNSMPDSDVAAYRGHFEAMIRDMRSELGADRVPFVAGKLGEFLQPEKQPHAPLIDAIVEETAQAVPAYAWADSAGLGHTGDSLHFDADGARELGRRYAEAYLRIAGKE